MNYIIDPMFFYLADISEAMKFIALILSTVAAATVIAFSIIKFNESDYAMSEEKRKLRRIIKIASFALVVSLTLFLLAPTKETLYKMQLAKLTTVENVDKTFEYIDKAVNKILEQK